MRPFLSRPRPASTLGAIFALASLFLLLPIGELRAGETATVGPGDRVRVTVFGEPDLSGEFELDAGGSFSMPLIGAVAGAHLDSRGLEARIADQFGQGFLRDPKVSVEILSLRPIYVLGEVNQPGSYPYRVGLSVLTAAAMAGGFTYRADEDDIEITRPGTDRPKHVAPSATVRPGDVIRIGERFF